MEDLGSRTLEDISRQLVLEHLSKITKIGRLGPSTGRIQAFVQWQVQNSTDDLYIYTHNVNLLPSSV